MTQPEQRIALEQYRNVIGYLQYENTTFWTRSGFMLIAHSALLGFLSRALPSPDPQADPVRSLTAMCLTILGLVLSFLWTRAINGALWWIDRWQGVLVRLEDAAYGDVQVFRGAVESGDRDAPRHALRRVAQHVALLFGVFWFIAFLYLLYIAWLLLCQ